MLQPGAAPPASNQSARHSPRRSHAPDMLHVTVCARSAAARSAAGLLGSRLHARRLSARPWVRHDINANAAKPDGKGGLTEDCRSPATAGAAQRFRPEQLFDLSGSVAMITGAAQVGRAGGIRREGGRGTGGGRGQRRVCNWQQFDACSPGPLVGAPGHWRRGGIGLRAQRRRPHTGRWAGAGAARGCCQGLAPAPAAACRHAACAYVQCRLSRGAKGHHMHRRSDVSCCQPSSAGSISPDHLCHAQTFTTKRSWQRWLRRCVQCWARWLPVGFNLPPPPLVNVCLVPTRLPPCKTLPLKTLCPPPPRPTTPPPHHRPRCVRWGGASPPSPATCGTAPRWTRR